MAYRPIRASITEEEARTVQRAVYKIQTAQNILALIAQRSLPNKDYYQEECMEGHTELNSAIDGLGKKYFPGRAVQNLHVNYDQKFLFGQEVVEP